MMRLHALTVAGSCLLTVAAAAQEAPDLTFQGLVQPIKQVTIIAPLDGILREVKVEEGQSVQAGQLLAQLDDALQVLMVEGARLRAEDQSDLKRASIALEDATLQHEQAMDLHRKGAASDFEVRQKKLQRDMAGAAVEAAQAQLVLAASNLRLEQEKLTRYRLTAPFAGRVFRLNAEQGATVTHDNQLMLLLALHKLQAQLYLPDTMYGQLEVGKSYRLLADEPVKRELTGRLTNIDRMIDTASRTFRCTFEIDNADEALPGGFMARLIWPQ